MKKRFFMCIFAAFFITSCARMEERQPRYDENQCPLCTEKPGECSYCDGNGMCSFCDGTGKRTNSSENVRDENIESYSYETECPYCRGTGKCRYCEGSGKCWACGGNGEVEDWSFYDKYKNRKLSEIMSIEKTNTVTDEKIDTEEKKNVKETE